MSATTLPASLGDSVLGGLPVAPPMLGMPLFGRKDFPVTHVSTAYVVASMAHRCVVLALARPDVETGGYRPEPVTRYSDG